MIQFILGLIILSSSAFAETVVVTTVARSEVRHADSTSEFFKIDFKTGNVDAVVNFQRAYTYCGGELGDCNTGYTVVKTFKAVVPGLKLNGEDLVFNGNLGPVACGYVRPGTIFHNRKVLVLNGNCSLETKLASEGFEVVFKTR